MVALVTFLALILAAGPGAPVAPHILDRADAQCRAVGSADDRVALVVTDSQRKRLAAVRLSVVLFEFTDAGTTRFDDQLETFTVDGGRSFSLAEPALIGVNAPGCQGTNVVIGPQVRACVVVVLRCGSSLDAGSGSSP
ncbi:MAG: hypothetical protein WAZ94_07550 [Phycisphaerales bacterium]